MKSINMSILTSGCVVLALVAMASCAHATTNTRVGGYTYASDVTGYVNMTRDYCDIMAAIGNDNAAALDIFYDGKNSERGAILRAYNDWATADHTGEPSYDAIMAGKAVDSLALNFEAAVNANSMPTAMLILDEIRMKYMMHEVDDIVTRTQAGLETGGPLDEPWAIMTGYPGSCLEQQHVQLAESLGLYYTGMPLAGLTAAYVFGNGQYAARNNQTAMVEAARLDIGRLVATHFLQVVHHHAYAAANCRRPSAVKTAKASIKEAAHILMPYAMLGGASETTLMALEKAAAKKNIKYKQVVNVVASVVEEMKDTGVMMGDLGVPIASWFKSYCNA